MPVTLSYPGVYIEELPSGVRTIVGVATSITAFIGRALRGPDDLPVRVQSFGEYDRVFGGLWTDSPMSYAVQHYFQHGGSDAIIVRVANNAHLAAIELATGGGGTLTLEAIGPGIWANALRASVSYEATKDSANLFTLTIQELATAGATTVVGSETFVNLSSDPNNPRFVSAVVNNESTRVRISGSVPPARPNATIANADDPNDATKYVNANGNGGDGDPIDDTLIADDSLQAGRKGIFALDGVDLFNMLYIPPLTFDVDPDPTATLAKAALYCTKHRAVLIIDPPASWNTVSQAQTGVNAMRAALGTDLSEHAACYFPRLRLADPLKQNRTATFAPGGAVAGVIARTDSQRGVWKAPAGLEASLVGVRDLSYRLTDEENGQLNPLGLNCLRSFPTFGSVVWGARTLAGADQLASEWKYLPVRRLALFIEESLFRGTQWVVFEPNDEPLWAQVRLNVGAFMQNLFRQGAFQGRSPREAYLVKCDKETTTQNDINLGVVNIYVGFAPLKPAEFVIIQIQQLAGQIAV